MTQTMTTFARLFAALPVVTAAVIALCIHTAASGTPIVTVDQQQTSENGINGFFSQGLGQSFTPTLSGLDAVELLLSNPTGNSAGAAVQVRDGSISGTILGTSLSVNIPGGVSQTVFHFDFSSTVPLTPSNLYVIEAITTSGTGNPRWWATNANPYAGGTMILGVTSLPINDFWFSEGLHATADPIAIPEPSTLALLGFGAIWIGIRARRGRKAA